MAFFNRILNFKKEEVAQRDQRGSTRYPVGAKFPIKAAVQLIGRDGSGALLSASTENARDWGGRLINLSSGGASVGISPAAMAARGEPSKVTFIIGEDQLELPCTIAHFRSYSQYANCGLMFQFPDDDSRRLLLQILEPVSIGASLKPVPPSRVKQDIAGLRKEEYRGDGESRLSVWTDPSDRSIQGFDFRMNAYGVRWSNGMSELETYGIKDGSTADGINIALTEAQQTEVRWLFCLAVPNLAKSIPAELRAFLDQLVQN